MNSSTLSQSCILCGHEQRRLWFYVDGSPIWRCPGCGLVSAPPLPLPVEKLYDYTYFNSTEMKGGYANYFAGVALNRATFAHRLHSISAKRESLGLARTGRILDIGCALGDFLELAHAVGWDTVGLEISTYAAAFAHKRRNLKIIVGSLDALNSPSAKFDVITLYDVLEHFEQPLESMRKVRNLLSPDGLVHLVTPNVEGVWRRLLGHSWYHFKPGEHLYYFSPTTIRRLLEASGFEVMDIHMTGSYMTPAYIFDRLRYYHKAMAETILSMLRVLRLSKIRFYMFAGEMEVWARQSK